MDGTVLAFVCVAEPYGWSKASCIENGGMEWESLLNTAAILGHATCVRILVDYHNANIEGLGSVLICGRYLDGVNPLWCAASKGHLEVVDFLLSKGANANGVTTFNSTPFGSSVFPRTLRSCQTSPGTRSLTDISRMEKIEALELLGASVLDKIRDAVGAVEYWKSALSLRYVDGTLMYPKPDHHLSCPLCDEFGEFTTVQQLEAIENNNNAVYVQSLLVRERILGTDDAGTMRSFRSTGLDYARCGDLKWCINLWLHAISMQQLQLKPLDPSRLFHLQSFVSLFAVVTNSNHTRKWNCKPSIYFEDLMFAFEVCTGEMAMVTYNILNETCICERKKHDSHLDQIIVVVMHLLVSLTRLQTEFWAIQWCKVKISVSRLVNMDLRDSTGSTLLHLACSLGVRDIGNLLLPISASLRTEIVDLLLETGSDPCARDHAGNTPLHILAWNEDFSESTVGALLSAGANLDDVNSRGETFGSLMASREQPLVQFEDRES
ncbi:protein fem-1 homolog A-like [Macrobrachium nipponense]|uniref:protein fem-1 homolog A-like n=1 Tax=Macrobrachium nipponense TaxID=159736 RepID=UPI0030C7ACEF